MNIMRFGGLVLAKAPTIEVKSSPFCIFAAALKEAPFCNEGLEA
jgi:hypothetical protein